MKWTRGDWMKTVGLAGVGFGGLSELGSKEVQHRKGVLTKVQVITHGPAGTSKTVNSTVISGPDLLQKDSRVAVAIRAFPDLKKEFRGKVEYVTVHETAPTITSANSVTGVSSRPERAPTVVRVLVPDSRLDAATDEREIKRKRIGEVVAEIVIGHGSA